MSPGSSGGALAFLLLARTGDVATVTSWPAARAERPADPADRAEVVAACGCAATRWGLMAGLGLTAILWAAGVGLPGPVAAGLVVAAGLTGQAIGRRRSPASDWQRPAEAAALAL